MASFVGDYTLTASRDLDVEDVMALYRSVGWRAYTDRPDIFPRMLSAASHVVAAFDSPDMVGLVRVVGDGVSVAVIQDLIVHPEHRRRGLGRELLSRALDATHDIRQTYITTDAAADNRHVVALYQGLGFTRSDDAGLTTLTLQR